MNCKICEQPTPDCEIKAYKGKCESCTMQHLPSVPCDKFNYGAPQGRRLHAPRKNDSSP